MVIEQPLRETLSDKAEAVAVKSCRLILSTQVKQHEQGGQCAAKIEPAASAARRRSVLQAVLRGACQPATVQPVRLTGGL